MLERQKLLLSPWENLLDKQEEEGRGQEGSAPLSCRVRMIFDGETKQILGYARNAWQGKWPVLNWFRRRLWQVFEAPDESLLFSVFRPWGFFKPWEIQDAEDRIVCTIQSGFIFDSGGKLQASFQVHPGKKTTLIADLQQKELATFITRPQGVILEFHPMIEDDPYAKMALLGATLVMAEDLALEKAS